MGTSFGKECSLQERDQTVELLALGSPACLFLKQDQHQTAGVYECPALEKANATAVSDFETYTVFCTWGVFTTVVEQAFFFFGGSD